MSLLEQIKGFLQLNTLFLILSTKHQPQSPEEELSESEFTKSTNTELWIVRQERVITKYAALLSS